MHLLRLTAAVLLTFTVGLPNAVGLALDLDLSALGVPDPTLDIGWRNDPSHPINQRFLALSNELGIAMAPQLLAPGETLGHSGFAFGVNFSFTDITEDHAIDGVEIWGAQQQSYYEGRDPAGWANTVQVHARKGLPFSFELGAGGSYLLRSEMYALFAEVKWALNEGWYWIPDLALRASGTRVLNTNQLDLVIASGDAVISKKFGIGGMLTLTPFLGYNVLLINAASRVITPPCAIDMDLGVGTCPGYDGSDPAAESPRYSLPQVSLLDNMTHRGFFGLRYWTRVFVLTGQVELAFVDYGVVPTYSVRIAADF